MGEAGGAVEFWTPEYWRGYAELDNPYRRYKLERDRHLALTLLAPADGQRILEVGCGYGRISRLLMESARIHLVAADRSWPMLKACRGSFQLLQADAVSLPFEDGVFDGVLCNGVLMHLRDQAKALQELCRVLRPGGRLVASGNNLLSPFAIPMMLWCALKLRVGQGFKPPWFYLRQLDRGGVQVQRVAGDTLLAVAATFPGSRRSLWPSSCLTAFKKIDQWVEKFPLKWMAYEVWLMGIKRGKGGRC